MKKLLFSTIMIGLFGCSSPKQDDFIGIWIGDSVKLELRRDGSCMVTGNNAYLLLGEDVKPSASNLTIKGYWELNYRLYQRNSMFEPKRIEVLLKNNDTNFRSSNILHYQKSFVSQSYTLYFDLSDPDDMNRFKFKKQ